MWYFHYYIVDMASVELVAAAGPNVVDFYADTVVEEPGIDAVELDIEALELDTEVLELE